jgi:hypothetical protein
MVFGTQVTLAERWTRSAGANTVSTTSDATMIYLNEGCREFAKRVHGIATEAFIVLAPKFDLDPNFAVRFTITGGDDSLTATDIPVASSTLTNATPTTVAAHLASNINAAVTVQLGSASLVVGWEASNWTFYVSPSGTPTEIISAAPSNRKYIDANEWLWGGAISKADTTLTGAIPLNCNVEQSLPAGFLEMEYVMFGNTEVKPAPFDIFMKPYSVGRPEYYSVKNKLIRLEPVPDEQDYFKIFYSGFPEDLATDGTDAAVECPLPEEVHMAPIHWAAAKLFDEAHEFDKSIYHQRCFNDFCTDYKIREANNNPTLFPSRSDAIPPRVVS